MQMAAIRRRLLLSFIYMNIPNKTKTFIARESSFFFFKLLEITVAVMVSAFIAGVAVAAAAYGGRYSIQAWQAFKARPPTAKLRRFYDGGFYSVMTKREAALILGIRESTPVDMVKEAHRRMMVANHPDAGGSHYLASKINEAKDLLLRREKGGGSAF
ncbi:mitochondrial import inner membrane translocase subunit TIM14-1 isoform X2 [Jatropha curcas]|uniref:mitochondrial import inner membrane translocase subunit TIM14-1 isoform X2 n=1 Tax=Jatropha curcas TaxID=180498 RepID=UPI001895413E|nr:mitochondrial import inner membrane translocase subunit TIM14-1 isoform X2 [Jatropha curcas]